jgi:lycopene cyclase domain-containing protein
MSKYLLIELGILVVPLLMSFEKRIRYYRNFPAVIASTGVICFLYIYWDIMATARGDWAFNARYVMPWRLLGLPLEEWLFFLVVPYSCLFIYESVNYFFKDRVLRISPFLWTGLAVLFFFFGLSNISRPYTFTVSLCCSCFFFIPILRTMHLADIKQFLDLYRDNVPAVYFD